MATASPTQGDEWVSINEAAKIMQCSKSWVLILLRRGALVGDKIHARAWMVSRKSATANAEEYRADTLGKRKVGRPRADNPPQPVADGHRPGRGVRSPQGNNSPHGASMVALDCDSMIVQASDLVSVLTASRISGFNRAWIYVLIERGDLWSITIDGQTFVRKADAKRLERGKPGRPKRDAAPAK